MKSNIVQFPKTKKIRIEDRPVSSIFKIYYNPQPASKCFLGCAPNMDGPNGEIIYLTQCTYISQYPLNLL